jgi:hypothetical protein
MKYNDCMKAVALALLALAVAVPAFAQQVDIRATPPGAPARGDEVVVPGPYYDVTRPSETDWYSHDVRVRHDPAFIAPLSREYETPGTRGRVGVAGWTSPNTPVGAPVTGYRDQNGWLAFGFAFTWGAPPTPARRAAPPGAARPAPAR